MKLEEIGHEIRRARLARGLSQAQLASAAGVTRTTLNLLENGLIKDLGIRKVEALLDELGLILAVDRRVGPKASDFLKLASTAASVSFKTALTERELLHALLTGKVPLNRRPHLRMLLEESPPSLLRGLVTQVGRWTKPGKLERNLDKITVAVGLPEGVGRWSKTSD
jgi:transcriptional regulator with XRE-family HTH domain